MITCHVASGRSRRRRQFYGQSATVSPAIPSSSFVIKCRSCPRDRNLIPNRNPFFFHFTDVTLREISRDLEQRDKVAKFKRDPWDPTRGQWNLEYRIYE